MTGLTPAAFAAILAVIIPLGAAPAHAGGPASVGIDNFTFVPAEITVTAGTEVTWINHDDIPHVVASSSKLFRSPVLDTDGSYAKSFDEPGTYEYFCALHPHMTGRVTVVPRN